MPMGCCKSASWHLDCRRRCSPQLLRLALASAVLVATGWCTRTEHCAGTCSPHLLGTRGLHWSLPSSVLVCGLGCGLG